MKVLRATLAGLMRMSQNSMLVLVMWLTVVLASLPAMLVMEDAIRTDLGPSLLGQDLRGRLDLGWLEEFQDRAGPVAVLLEPVRVSSAMWLDNLELWLSGEWLTENRGLAATAVTFILIWILLQGGVLGGLADRGERFSWGQFLGSSGAFFFRFLRLALLMGVAYFGVYRLALWLFPAIEIWTRDVTAERTVLAIHLTAAVLIAALMVTLHLISEFSKIAMVRESRRSTVLAVFRSLAMVSRYPLQSAGLMAVMSGLLVGWQIVYLWSASGSHGANVMATVGVVLTGQVFMIGRWALRIARLSAEIHLFDQWALADKRAREGPGKDETQSRRT